MSVSRAAGGASRQNGRSQACGAVVGGLAAGKVGLFGAGAGAGLALTLGWARRVSACEALRLGAERRNRTSPPLSQPHASLLAHPHAPRASSSSTALDSGSLASSASPHFAARARSQDHRTHPSSRRSCSSPLRTKAARVPQQLACIGQFQSPCPAARLPVPVCLPPERPPTPTPKPTRLRLRRTQHA